MDKQSSHAAPAAVAPMSSKDARKVMWLRNNYRPLGELLDEGYLNQTRLQWAAEKAYNAQIRTAAKVLLDEMKQSPRPTPEKTAPALINQASADGLQIGIPLEQASATLWPFPPFKGQPMGPLSEARQLSLKDLGYAIENAWDARVRHAAMALMLVRLEQAVKEPAPDAGFLRVVAGERSYAEKQQLRLTLLEGTIMGACLGALSVMTVWALSQQASGQSGNSPSTVLASPAATIIALAILAGLLAGALWLIKLVFNLVIGRLDEKIESYRKGQEGENRVVEITQQALDGNWVLFRNVMLPGRNKTDLDAVLVGPSGVWVLEVKTYAGKYRNAGDRWEYRQGSRWKALNASPSRQAEGNAIRLASFLRAGNITQWVTPVVVWANQESHLAVENPATAVWSLDRLPDELGNLWHDHVSDANGEAIVSRLTQLAQQQSGAGNAS